jgi:hypothetical protein
MNSSTDTEARTDNSTFAIGGVPTPLDSFVVAEGFVFLINICGKMKNTFTNSATSQICKPLAAIQYKRILTRIFGIPSGMLFVWPFERKN